MPRVIFLLPLVLFLGLAGYFYMGLATDPRQLPSALIDKPAPEFDLPALLSDLPGLAKGDLGGDVKLVNFFASWCVPCRAEHSLLMRIAELNLVPLYGINYKNRKEAAIDWLDELGNPYQRIGQDLTGRAGIEWGVYGLPETYIIDKQGRIRYRHVGPLFPKVLKKTIMPLIEELRR
jgi:cytochrome c biogenesis protein CcmG/thiol:disulfide interchange protein DsbE